MDFTIKIFFKFEIKPSMRFVVSALTLFCRPID